MQRDKAVNLNANKLTLGNSFMGNENIDILCSNPDHKISINGIVPNVSLGLSQDYTGDNNHTGNLNYEGNNTHSGSNTYTGDSTFGNDQGSGGVGKAYHWGQVYFEDSSISGDAGLPSQSLCRTATNKLTTYDLLGDPLTFTGAHIYQGNNTHSGTNSYTGTSTFGQISPEDGSIGQAHFHGGVKFFNGTLSGDAAQPSKTMCITATDKLTAYDLLGDDFTTTGDWTNNGDIVFGGGVECNDETQCSGNLIANGSFFKAKSDAPSSTSDTGNEGEWRWDDNGPQGESYLYVCTASDTWRRVELVAWQ